jgi:hypothetical protein
MKVAASPNKKTWFEIASLENKKTKSDYPQ